MIVSDNINDISEEARAFGFYEYNGKFYSNKFQALQDAGENYVKWNFNDENFCKFDFSKEPKKDVYELYADRARQLREKYDKIILYYSGGIDSTVMLRAFVDNQIPIDAVVIQGMFNTKSTLTDINTAEQTFVGLPYIRQLEKEKNIKLNVYLLDVLDAHKNYKENWMYRCSYNIQPTVTAMSYFEKDPYLQQMAMSGKACTIRGIDKPRLVIKDGKWTLGFLDVSIGGAASRDLYHIGLKNYLHDEFFYWSKDCPWIISKQCHMIIRELERRFTYKQCRNKFSNLGKFDKSEYGNIVEPIIYGRYLKQKIGEERPYFYVKSGISNTMGPKSWWFFHAKNELHKDHEEFVQGVLTLQKTIHEKHFNLVPNAPKKIEKLMKHSQLDRRLMLNPGKTNPMVGTVGCWSPFYFLKNCKIQ